LVNIRKLLKVKQLMFSFIFHNILYKVMKLKLKKITWWNGSKI